MLTGAFQFIPAIGYSEVISAIKDGVNVVMSAFSAINGNWLFLGVIVLAISFVVISSVIGFLRG